jgi:hypothetical protein
LASFLLLLKDNTLKNCLIIKLLILLDFIKFIKKYIY